MYYGHAGASKNQPCRRAVVVVFRAMSSSNKNDEVITWYAFQCPTLSREYFYEPISGKKTWALPTCKILSEPVTKSDQPQKNTVSVMHQEVSIPYPSIKIKEQNMRISSNPPTKLGLVIVITLIVSLMCNTVFLVVLVKVSDLRASHAKFAGTPEEGQLNQTNASTPQSVYTKHETVEEVTADTAMKEQVNYEFTVDVPVTNNDVTERDSETEMANNEHLSDATQLTNIENNNHAKFSFHQTGLVPDKGNTNHKTESIDIEKNGESSQRKDKNTEPMSHSVTKKRTDKEQIQNKNTQSKTPSEAPPQCWVPFAYLVNPRCRRNNVVGLDRPLFDAEQFARAII